MLDQSCLPATAVTGGNEMLIYAHHHQQPGNEFCNLSDSQAHVAADL